ncbi:MAG TPA: hypothetical protein VMW42_10055, partial [Desulfatiglandales bacterium]|nr:hypothetical protein [Desulfatiglandales bacterium]
VRAILTIAATKQINMVFLYDLSPLTMAAGDNFVFLELRDGAAIPIVLRLVGMAGSQIAIRCYVLDDLGGLVLVTSPAIKNSGQIEVKFKGASIPGANDGVFELYTNGVLAVRLLNQDTDIYEIDELRIGAIDGVDAGTFGSLYIDNICYSNQIR